MAVKAQFPDEQSAEGEFERQEDAFRDWVSADGSTPYPAVVGSSLMLSVRQSDKL